MLFFALLIVFAACEEMLVTKEYVDYLKRHVDFEVMEYEENPFRGYTVEEAADFLGMADLPYMDTIEVDEDLTLPAGAPSSIDWRQKAPTCVNGVRNQGHCGSCWAFGTAGMLGSRCCINGGSFKLLSTQELVGCVQYGCRGSWPTWALNYVAKVGGLVLESCVPYLARTTSCPKACTASGQKWVHYCGCNGSYRKVIGNSAMMSELLKGPVTVAFWVCNSFFHYKNGTYKCDCSANGVGLHAVLAVGFDATGGSCNKYMVRNSWGSSWGNRGFFDIGCNECGINGKYPEGNVACDVKA